METKIIIYHYIESSGDEDFSDTKKPFVLSEAAQEFKVDNRTIFKNCSGLKVIDYFKDKRTHIRLSFWQLSSGYEQWEQQLEISSYLKARFRFQAKNHITATLEGPFEATQYD